MLMSGFHASKASLLRKIVAGPRLRHPEAGLDLCYVTDQIIATSGPSSSYPQLAYRNPLAALVKFLDDKHGDDWAIWEFRAEGTGYPDDEVYGRIWHYPWPDHHPPPFAMVPNIMASMRNWLRENGNRVVVVHCKAGKGRSGTMACSYLISECDWKPSEALDRFTERRMRFGFGQGVSIPSQLRWIHYVDRWTQQGKVYLERKLEVVELQLWGLRDGVKIIVEGFAEEGKMIKTFHVFADDERVNVDTPRLDGGKEILQNQEAGTRVKKAQSTTELEHANGEASHPKKANSGWLPNPKTEPAVLDSSTSESEEEAVIYKSKTSIVLPTSDVNIDFERRNRGAYGLTMVTSVAHVWFNGYFEGDGPDQHGLGRDSGVFGIDWDAMDGIKGSSRKGARAFDRLCVVWKAHQGEAARPEGQIICEPEVGEEVKQTQPADWKGEGQSTLQVDRDLGIRKASPSPGEDGVAGSIHSLDAAPSTKTSPRLASLVNEHFIGTPSTTTLEAHEKGSEGQAQKAAGTGDDDASKSEQQPSVPPSSGVRKSNTTT
ncbi:MAG: Telomerase protein component 1 [Caeruleum heppii]|nr:MAG: Telomerase protein component 1 [Caeruleum heppii]